MEAVSTPAGRVYVDDDSRFRAPSVTSVIAAVWPSEPLDRWRMRNVARRAVENAPQLRRRLKRLAERDGPFREMAARRLADLLWEWRDDSAAADRGTRIHAVFEGLVTGAVEACDVTGPPDEAASALRAADAVDAAGLEIVWAEATLSGTDPRPFAGTADLIARDTQGRLCVIDLKTGRRFSRTAIPQLGAYSLADTVWPTPDTAAEVPDGGFERALVLLAHPGSHQWYEISLDDARSVWRACSSLHYMSGASRGARKRDAV